MDVALFIKIIIIGFAGAAGYYYGVTKVKEWRTKK